MLRESASSFRLVCRECLQHRPVHHVSDLVCPRNDINQDPLSILARRGGNFRRICRIADFRLMLREHQPRVILSIGDQDPPQTDPGNDHIGLPDLAGRAVSEMKFESEPRRHRAESVEKVGSYVVTGWPGPMAEHSQSCRFGSLSECLNFPAPAKIVVKVPDGDAMEWPQPFLQSAMVTIDVVDMKVGCFRPRAAWLARMQQGIFALRAKLTIAFAPSRRGRRVWSRPSGAQPSASVSPRRR